MKISKKDWGFIALAVVVLVVFYVISGPEKTKQVPNDDRHREAYAVFKQTGSKKETDKTCPSCHFEPGGIPFPKEHPLKPKDGPMSCHLCHKLKKIS